MVHLSFFSFFVWLIRSYEQIFVLLAFYSVSYYIFLMDVIVEFNEAAFRHGISKEDILCALKTRIRAGAIGEFPEKYAVIGFDLAGNPLEIMYNPVDDNTISVFHAMKVRKSFIKMLGL
jgi:hypothetical protein